MLHIHGLSPVNQRHSHIRVGVENFDRLEPERIDKLGEPLEREYLVAVLHPVHTGIGDIRHLQIEERVAGALEVLHQIPELHTFGIIVVHPPDEVSGFTHGEKREVQLGSNTDRRCTVGETGEVDSSIVNKNHFRPPSSPH